MASLGLLLFPCLAVALPSPAAESVGFKQAANLLKNAVNLSADPCDDFYNYACGNWEASNEIPPDKTSISRFVGMRQDVQDKMKDLLEAPSDTSKSKARAMVRTMYEQCLDKDALERDHGQEMVKALKRVGLWPMVESAKFDPKKFDLTMLLVEAGARGVNPFLDVYITIDAKNTSRRLLSVDQGELGLGTSARDYYLNTTKYAKQVKAYNQYILDKMTLVAEDYGSNVTYTALKADVEKIFKMEQGLAEIMTPEENRRNYTELYNIHKLSELTSFFPLVDWPRYFKGAAPHDAHHFIDSNPDILVSEVAFLGRLTKLLSATDPRIVTNYIMLRYSGSFSLLYDSRYQDAYQRFMSQLLGRDSRSERWKECVQAASTKMSHASSALYAAAHFDKSAKDATLAMIGEIKGAIKALLTENEWMDPVTKKEALAKAEQMITLMGFADWVLNDEKLDAWYEGLDILPSDSLATILNKTHRWSNNLSYRRLLTQVDRAEFNTNSATVNAFYSSIKNAIMFPAGIMQPPFFHRSFPKALNYGAIGNQFDGTGNLHEWWQPQTREEFTRRATCIVEQYGNVTIPEIGHNINGKQTQGENIADNGGVKAAYRAYKSYLSKHGEEPRLPGELAKITNEQLFFLGFAQTSCHKYKKEAFINTVLTDVHAPGRYRVEIVSKNQPEFAKAFSCPVGSRMNPVHRCSVW